MIRLRFRARVRVRFRVRVRVRVWVLVMGRVRLRLRKRVRSRHTLVGKDVGSQAAHLIDNRHRQKCLKWREMSLDVYFRQKTTTKDSIGLK